MIGFNLGGFLLFMHVKLCPSSEGCTAQGGKPASLRMRVVQPSDVGRR